MIKACILDMDGVIVDTEAIHMESFRFFLNEQQINFTEEFIRSLVGYSTKDNIIKIRDNLITNRKLDINRGIKRRDEIYLNLIASRKLNPLPGVLELTSYCTDNHVKLALASSSDWIQVDTIMNRILDNYRSQFDVIVTGDDVKNKKPAPDIYLRTVENLNVPSRSCIAFEDSRAGVESAKTAGIICFAIRNKYTKDIHLKSADKIINSVQEAVDNNFWRY